MVRWLLLATLLLGACDHHDDAQGAAATATAPLPPLPPLPPFELPDASTPPTIPPDGGRPCGAKGYPDCPMQAWMKQSLTPPLMSQDWQGLAAALERCADVAPPDAQKNGYANWVSISKDGANAARAAELDAVKAACRGCHEQYRDKYRSDTRTRLRPIASP